MLHNKKIIISILAILSVFILFTKLYAYKRMTVSTPTPTSEPAPSLWFEKPSNPDNIRCTADVKQCPDESYVGRIAPSCSFAPCPKDKYQLN